MIELKAEYGLWLSVIMGIVIVFNLYKGYRDGFLATLFNLLRLVISIGLASMLSPILSEQFPLVNLKTSGIMTVLVQLFQIQGSQIIWFVVIFLVLQIVTGIIGRFLKLVNLIPLVGWLNQVLGIGLGLLVAWLKLYILIIILFLPLFSQPQVAIDQSALVHVQTTTSWLDSYLKTVDMSQIAFKLSSSEKLSDTEIEKVIAQLRKSNLSEAEITKVIESLQE